MQIAIRNFRKVLEATTAPARLTCIMGGNQAGKTSILNAVGAALLGDKQVYGATQQKPWPVVRNGQRTASVMVKFENASYCSLAWPGDADQSGFLPAVNEITMGRVDPAYDFDKKEWADFIRSLVGAKGKITGKMIREELKKLPYSNDEVVEQVMQECVAGIDAALACCKKDALSWRRAWSSITHDNFGQKKAAERTQAFRDEDQGTPLEERKAELEQLNKWLAAAKAAEAQGNENAEALQSQMAILQTEVEKLQAELKLQTVAYDAAKVTFDAIHGTERPLACPHCAGLVVLKDGQLEQTEGITVDPKKLEEKEQARTVMNIACKKGQDLQCDIQARTARMSACRGIIQNLFETKAKDGDPQGRSAEELEVLVQYASTFIRDYEQEANAARAYELWEFHTAAEKLLSPTGMRLKALQASLGEVQERMDTIAEYLFPGHAVFLEINAEQDGINLMFDDMPYQQLTWNGDPNSYRLRIQYLFQLIAAEILGDDAPVILDRLDTLELGVIGLVLKYLAYHKRHALIARTMPAKPEKDKLKAAGVGITYWLNDQGTLEGI